MDFLIMCAFGVRLSWCALTRAVRWLLNSFYIFNFSRVILLVEDTRGPVFVGLLV